jgi:hypothetical protein
MVYNGLGEDGELVTIIAYVLLLISVASVFLALKRAHRNNN